MILTVYVFLQDFRTTLIPAITIPVSLIGTFGMMMVLGLSINTLSLFGLVLAIGIVVDDAIVVVENTMRLIDQEKLPAKQATIRAMEEVTGPVVATTLVLLAVFVPTAMMGGITGRLYSQFAVTIAVSTVFSSLNALTLSPALCGVLLRSTEESRRSWIYRLLGWFFRGFNFGFDKSTGVYMSVVGMAVRRAFISMILFAALVAATVYGFLRVPGGFLPDEDQGYFMVNMELPDGATLERTRKVLDKVQEILDNTPGVQNTIAINGYNVLDGLVSPNAGAFFVVLKSWDKRTAADQQVDMLVQSVQQRMMDIPEAVCLAFPPPPITGLGNAGGFDFRLEDAGGAGLAQLETIGDDLVFEGNASPVLTRLNNNFRARVPQLYLEVDREKVKKLGIPLQTVFSTLQAYLGSAYVNDFNTFGRVYKVQIQADHQFRNKISDIRQLDVRNANGDMVPLSTLLTVEDTAGPKTVYRYNMYPSATITGQPRLGYSSGQAISAMEQLADRTLPRSMRYEWSGITFQQIQAGAQAPIIFVLAITFVYLFLAAQYESWTIPLSVMLSVSLALLGAIWLTWARAFDNNVYTQIGLVLLIGLSSKSAILIVEFAKQRRTEGLSIIDAALEACRLRFRAILMTAFSFILGVVPLVIASGAGAASRRTLGTAVFGGMTAATVLGVFFIPVLYVVVQKMTEWAWPPPDQRK